jgi:hypothetical protein
MQLYIADGLSLLAYARSVFCLSRRADKIEVKFRTGARQIEQSIRTFHFADPANPQYAWHAITLLSTYKVLLVRWAGAWHWDYLRASTEILQQHFPLPAGLNDYSVGLPECVTIQDSLADLVHLGQILVTVRITCDGIYELASVPSAPHRHLSGNVFAAVMIIDIGIGPPERSVETAPSRPQKTQPRQTSALTTHFENPDTVYFPTIFLPLVPGYHTYPMTVRDEPFCHQ